MSTQGERFAKLFDTHHGQLLVYVEFIDSDTAHLRHVMHFDGATIVHAIEGTPEQAASDLVNLGFNEAEHRAIQMFDQSRGKHRGDRSMEIGEFDEPEGQGEQGVD